jgi:hypothetical protein
MPRATGERPRGSGEGDLFVQLLSELPGRKFDDEPDARVALRLRRPATALMPILQWRSRDVDWAKVRTSHTKILG